MLNRAGTSERSLAGRGAVVFGDVISIRGRMAGDSNRGIPGEGFSRPVSPANYTSFRREEITDGKTEMGSVNPARSGNGDR
jgi:hypothetical protein